jgi:hypothetical protein
LGNDEASSEFRPKIPSMKNRISSHSSTRRHSPGTWQQAHSGWHFSRGAWLAAKDNTRLLHLVHSDDLKYVKSFARFFNLFQRFVIWVSFIDCESSTLWVISDAPIAKVGWRFHNQMLMNSWDTVEFLDSGRISIRKRQPFEKWLLRARCTESKISTRISSSSYKITSYRLSHGQ